MQSGWWRILYSLSHQSLGRIGVKVRQPQKMRVFARAAISFLVLAAVLSIGVFLIQMPAIDHSLRFGAQTRGLLLGAAVTARPLKNDVIYAQTLAREFNILVPENAMKFSA